MNPANNDNPPARKTLRLGKKRFIVEPPIILLNMKISEENHIIAVRLLQSPFSADHREILSAIHTLILPSRLKDDRIKKMKDV